MGCASGYLKLLHTLIGLAGLACIGISIYLVATGQQFLPDGAGEYAWTVWLPLALGVVIVALSICGCCCESAHSPGIIILIFSLIQFVFGIAIVAAGAALIILSTDTIVALAAAPQATEGLDDGAFQVNQEVSDFFLGLYYGCCEDDLTTPNLLQCPAFTPSDGGTFSYCFVNQDVYAAGVESGRVSKPAYCAIPVLKATCAPLPQVNAFLKANESLLQDNILPAGIAFTIFGVLLLLAGVASCVLGCDCCCGSESAPPPQQQTARETAYGKPQGAHRNDIQYA